MWDSTPGQELAVLGSPMLFLVGSHWSELDEMASQMHGNRNKAESPSEPVLCQLLTSLEDEELECPLWSSLCHSMKKPCCLPVCFWSRHRLMQKERLSIIEAAGSRGSSTCQVSSNVEKAIVELQLKSGHDYMSFLKIWGCHVDSYTACKAQIDHGLTFSEPSLYSGLLHTVLHIPESWDPHKKVFHSLPMT